jgi:molybdenum cofactor sulfurtransferase
MGNSHSGPPPSRRRNAKDSAITYGSKDSKSAPPSQIPIKVQFPSALSSRINLPNPHPLDRALKQHKSEHSLLLPTYAYTPSQDQGYPDDLIEAYKSFLKVFPEYQLTWLIDTLRRSDFSRVHNSGETYVDYMGGSLYPESLIQCHTAFLNKSVMGNTHSVSNT